MKLFFRNSVNKGVLTYFKDVFLAGRHEWWSRFFLLSCGLKNKYNLKY